MPRQEKSAGILQRYLARGLVGLTVLAGAALLAGGAQAENIKIGTVRVTAFAPVFIAQEKGYFAAEGIPAEMVYFDAALPPAMATVSHNVDFGIAAMTAGFYNLAGQGALKLIAAAGKEQPGFQIQGYFVSSRAWNAGLRGLKDLPGHSFAVTGPGGPPVYVVGGLVAEKYGFDFKTIRLVPLQTIANTATATAGGKTDFTVSSLTASLGSLMKSGQIHQMGWVGDTTPWQFSAVFTGTQTANERPELVKKFLRAYIKGARYYHDAFTGPGETRKDGPAAQEVLAIMAKYTEEPVAEVKLGIPFVDAQARLDVKDIEHQVSWYKSQGYVKPEVKGESLIDLRYAVPLPTK